MGVINITGVLVGNEGVGKTTFLYRYITGSIPGEYPPENLSRSVDELVDNKRTCIDLLDTQTNEDYDRLRLLAYSKADVFLICFSLVDRSSYDDVKRKWYPEVSSYSPDVPVVLIGTKLDLRDDKESAQESETPTTIIEGLELQKDINAAKYIECSSITGRQVHDVVEEAIRAVLNQTKKNTKCGVL
ncbi:PREDICTED: ras-related C3 botulinum toxin substrate 1-like isoform X2 [Amphimedon queenslandica]|nr:PREDICTED: ras-related C3 botulinum toxin substrate 1-like isoform X2 [Amphimedon queenslandica]|eukprot:XP_003387181.1 PREDICTED: ras-related C3 botulinum toxin substrate 1-like isoform X2 [Amphimedon queenslandica]